MHETPITTSATIVQVRRQGVFDARLPNGKIVCAHLSKSVQTSQRAAPVPGTPVELALTPYDFETARITAVGAAS